MTPLEIVTRFDIHYEGFHGRAYLFPSSERAYENVKEAVLHMGAVLVGPELDAPRKRKFSLTNAIMWGSSHNEKMIDFFGIGSDKSLNFNWDENPDIFSWVTKKGVILPPQQISEITCGK